MDRDAELPGCADDGTRRRASRRFLSTLRRVFLRELLDLARLLVQERIEAALTVGRGLPLLLDDNVRQLRAGQYVSLVGQGEAAGLTSFACLLNWPWTIWSRCVDMHITTTAPMSSVCSLESQRQASGLCAEAS